MDLSSILCYKMIKAVKVKNIKNSLPFLVIITQLLKKYGVQFLFKLIRHGSHINQGTIVKMMVQGNKKGSLDEVRKRPYTRKKFEVECSLAPQLPTILSHGYDEIRQLFFENFGSLHILVASKF